MDFEKMDELIRQGRADKVRTEINGLTIGSLSRKEKLSLANIARRVNYPMMSLKILSPVVRPKGKKFYRATNEELVAYAAGLLKIGVINEARDILAEQDERIYPQILFFEALGLFTQWEYKQAIPKLNKYINSSDISDYQRLVGNVNLMAAHIHCDNISSSMKVLKGLESSLFSSGNSLLIGNACELAGQACLLSGDLKGAESYLNQATEVLKETHGVYRLYIKKWLGVLGMRQDKIEWARTQLLAVKAQALEWKEWETLRDCGAYLAEIDNDQGMARRIYFGTPHLSYKRWLRSNFQGDMGKTYDWNPFREAPSKSDISIDINSHGADLDLKSNSMLYKLFHFLTEDFYRPRSQGEVFSHLYPGEFYNAESSYQRQFKVVMRLRKLFEKQNLPLLVDVEDHCFKLTASADLTIKVHDGKPAMLSPVQLLVIQLKSKIEYRSFSSQSICDILDCSKFKANQVIKEALSTKKIKTQGVGRSTRYYFSKSA